MHFDFIFIIIIIIVIIIIIIIITVVRPFHTNPLIDFFSRGDIEWHILITNIRFSILECICDR